ncbi:winged helix-turn-helix domain-containing protein [Actinoplanes regularis]|uniref:Transcriptional regulator, ArsR family n=1 Tax=Actinoplanes regularis TaxID=52697 RepID=A0A238YC34_9ACTN|nr:winged helix-turn-helix domain-containing protein [Actinoplanes regularis]GIE86043.1 transcriptional regulator [Actinoplanes regularis]SNR68154.1 transcriptional regulator, ArsR family [Actinoplanes regularis]
MTARQSKQITDPQALRALAHPIRLKLLELLTVDGPATGRRLADLTGESTASVSYHVSQLVRWGLVEPALDLARGRERPWQATSRGITWSATGDGSPEFAAASRALREQFIARRLAALDEFQRREDEFDTAWREAAWIGEDLGHLDPAELTEATQRIKAVLAEYTDTARPRREGARKVAFFAYAVPVPDDPS